MALIVMKFGGTSVADMDRIRNVAAHVKREVDAGNKVAVVVSAMAGKTNELVGWVNEAASIPDPKEYDAVVSSGEQVTSISRAKGEVTLNLVNPAENIDPGRFALHIKLPINDFVLLPA